MTGFESPTVALAGYKPADQGPRGQLRGAAREPAEGMEQLPGEEGGRGSWLLSACNASHDL